MRRIIIDDEYCGRRGHTCNRTILPQTLISAAEGKTKKRAEFLATITWKRRECGCPTLVCEVLKRRECACPTLVCEVLKRRECACPTLPVLGGWEPNSRRGSPGFFVRHLPDLANLVRRLDHRLPRLALKSLRELRHVHHHAIDPVPRRRVRVRDGQLAHHLRPDIRAIPLRESYEEPLLRCEPVNRMQLLAFRRVLPGHPCKDLPAQIG